MLRMLFTKFDFCAYLRLFATISANNPSASPSCLAQSRRHDKYPTQSLLQGYGLFRTESRTDAASQASLFISFGHVIGIEGNRIRWAPLHAGAAAGANFRIDYGQVISGVAQRQRAAAPELKGIAAVFAAIADARLRAGLPRTRMKSLVNQARRRSFIHNAEGFFPGDFPRKSLGRGVAGGFSESKAIQGGRVGVALMSKETSPLSTETVANGNIVEFLDNFFDRLTR